MNEQPYTKEQLHIALHDYLLSKKKESGATAILQELENEIPGMLQEYFGAELNNIYELNDEATIVSYQKKIKLHPILRNVELHMEPRYTEALKWYRLFIKKISSATTPFLVPGEEDLANYKVTESKIPYPKIVIKTIYLEGEAGEAQPKEIRIRNKKLREACIDYFKFQHNGCIVCECCGFDFSRAFDIPDEYIEVHHRYPFSQTEGEHEVDAIQDLVPLCANCHRMIHHLAPGKGTCVDFEKLKEKYRGVNYKTIKK